MKAPEIRQKFIAYFKKQEHVVVPSSSLVPDNDPSVLLTTAGMQQFKPYLLGHLDPTTRFRARRLTSVQRCFRTSDIDAVGDASHLTFFEMLGNFSIGDYSKAGTIRFAWECLTKTFNVPKKRLWVTIFEGDTRTVKDFEAFKFWQEYVATDRITSFGRSENWWGPPGTSGPCGPSSEIHVDRTGQPCERQSNCRPNCPCGRFLELWNLVFMEYFQDEAGAFSDLPTKNVDTGMGLERLALILQDVPTVFETDLFAPIIRVAAQSGAVPAGESHLERTTHLRIVTDHLKAAVFLVADGVRFSNKDRGYILRRVFRRALDQLTYPLAAWPPIAAAVIDRYQQAYPFLAEQRSMITSALTEEAEGFLRHIDTTLKRVTAKDSRLSNGSGQTKRLTPEQAFTLFTTHGTSPARLRRAGFNFDEKAVKLKIEEHRRRSRAGAAKKFGGHGLGGYALDASRFKPDAVARLTRLHTATHLLQQALRTVLGSHVRQNGSDITPERLRFDFTHPTKLTAEQLAAVENLINQQVRRDLPVSWQELSPEEALQAGALSFFRERYPARVKVYSIGDFSKEICGGPHVKRSSEVGRVKIISEKSSAAGIRRIKATVEP
ncbi:MAG: alanine--tRNA ligase [Candidatus Kerfeldbacteria bacterium]|nr:alanine--tRNA ligase [Candidatus Kerfeldbacteria bacterium]